MVIAVAVVAFGFLSPSGKILLNILCLETHFQPILICGKRLPKTSSVENELPVAVSSIIKTLNLPLLVVSPYSCYIGKSLRAFVPQEWCSRSIVRRPKIYIPKSSERIYPQDNWQWLVSTATTKVSDEIESPQGVPDRRDVPRDEFCTPFTVNEAFHFLDKSIVQSRLGERR